MLQMAEDYKGKAKLELEYISEDFGILPKLGDAKHFQVLINSFAGAGTVLLLKSDIRTALASIGAALIGSLTAQFTENVMEWRGNLARASAYFEMAQFYNHASLLCPIRTNQTRADSSWIAFMNYSSAVDSLTLCDMHVLCCYDFDAKIIVSKYITTAREKLLAELNNGNATFTKGLLEELEGYEENLGEALADYVTNEFIYRNVIKEFRKAVKFVEAAERGL